MNGYPELPTGFEWETDPAVNPMGLPADSGSGYTEGLATTFGYQDPGESPVGAWGYDLSTPNAYGVSLPRQTLRDYFGDENEAEGALVEVTNPKTGRTIIAPIVDKGPADWVIDRQGPTIDLTEGARQAIGNGGMDPATWRILPKLPEGYSYEGTTGQAGQAGQPGQPEPAQPTGAGAPQLPEGFTWDIGDKYGQNLSPDLTQTLFSLEQASGVPLNVISGYRDPEHNARVGGAKSSQHIHGNAVDIDTSEMSHDERLALIQQASAAGITGIGVYDNNLHFDVGERRGWGPSHGAESVPDWAQDTMLQHLRGEFKPAPQAPQQLPQLPEGFTWETPQAAAPPAQTRQDIATQNREKLFTAIADLEEQGYKVPHFIGTDNEPEGDRGPTMDMENVVAALKKQEADTKDPAQAAQIAEKRAYWENQIKTIGMSAEQWKKQTGEPEPGQAVQPQAAAMNTFSKWGQDFTAAKQEALQTMQAEGKPVDEARATGRAFQKATSALGDESAKAMGLKNAQELKSVFKMLPSNIMEVDATTANQWFTEALRNASPELAKTIPPAGFQPERGLADQMFINQMAFPGEGPERLPKLSPDVARKLGLKEWRDLDTGFEVRRAERPDYGTPAPTPLVPKKYEGMSQTELQAKLEAAKPDYRPEWAPPAPAKAPEDYRPEWAPPPVEPAEGIAGADLVKLGLQGASDQGLLSILEGGYAAVAGVLPEGKIRDNAVHNRDEISKMRENIREKHLPVDPKTAQSFLGGLANTVGQMPTNLLSYAIPGLGPLTSVLSLYDEGRQDYRDTMKEQGKPVDEAKANEAGWKYAMAAGPLDIALDKLQLKKFFKASKAKGWDTGKVVKEGTLLFTGGAASEGLQQLWLNTVANLKGDTGTVGYDPNRPTLEGVAQSAAVGGGASLLVGAAGAVRTEKGRQERAANVETALNYAVEQAKAARAAAFGTQPPEAPTAAAAPQAAQPEAAPVTPTSGTPAALAAEKPQPPAAPQIMKDFSQLPTGMGTQPEETTASVPVMMTKAMEAGLRTRGFTQEQIDKMTPTQAWQNLNPTPTPVAATTPAGAAPTTPAAATQQPVATPEQEAEVQALMAQYEARGGAFGRGAPVTQPTTPTGAAPKPPGIISQFLGGVRRAVLGKSQFEVSQDAAKRHYKERQILSDQRHRDPALWEAEIEAPMREQAMESPIVKALGADIEFNPGMDAPMAASYSPSGKLTLVINPVEMQALENSSGNTGQAFSFYLGEELDHFGEIGWVKDTIYDPAIKAYKDAHAQWVAGGQQGPAPQPKYKELHEAIFENRARLFVDMRNTLKGAPPSEQRALYQAAVDAYNVYFAQAANAPSPGSKGLQATAAQADKIFAEISSRPGGAGFSSFVAEFTRQARQQRNQGNITESVWRKVLELIKGWYRQSLDRLQKALPGVQEGKFGAGMQKHVQNIEDFLSGKGVEIAPPGAPTTWQKGGAKGLPAPAKNIVNIHNSKGGSTINAVHGDISFTNTYSVSIFPDMGITSPGKRITEKQINDFDAKLRAAGINASDENITIGTWYDAKADVTYIDAAITTTDRAQAIALGKQFNQKAVYSLGDMAEINTGGTGLAVAGIPSVQERLASVTATGYTIPYATTTTETTTGAGPAYEPRTPPEGLPGGGEGGPEALGGIQSQAARGAPTPELQGWRIGQESERIGKLKGDQYTKETAAVRKAFSEIPEKSLGIDVIEDPTIDEVAFAGINELDGGVIIVYNPHRVQAQENISFQNGRRPGEAIDTVINHELAHAAEYLMAKDQGIELEELHQRLYDDITKTIAGAPPKQQRAIYQTLIDSYNTYFGETTAATPPITTTAKQAMADPAKLFKEMAGQRGVSGWMSEFVRQAHEATARGEISESLLTKLLNVLKGWFTAAVDRLKSKKGLPGVLEGKFGPAMQRHVEGIKDLLNGRGVSFKPSEIPLTDEQIDAYAKEGEAFKEWYTDFLKELEDFLGPYKEYAPLLREFLASTSPQEGIESNVRRAVENLVHFINTGEILSTFKTHGDNLRRATLGQMLSGPKVGEYSPALHGDPYAVTMDRHMFEAIFGTQNITEGRRKIATNAIFRAAARLGWDPAEVQAAIWGAKLARDEQEVSEKKTYGKFLEQYRQELEEIFRREAIHGGRGIETARRAALGVSERAGPERARREAAYQAALKATGAAPVSKKPKEPKPKPRPKPEPAEVEARRYERGKGISAAKAPAAGGPVAPDARIKRGFYRFMSGARDVFNATPGLEFLGSAITKHVDVNAAMKGELGSPLVARGLPLRTGPARKQFREYIDTWLDPKKGRAAADALGIGTEAQRLVAEAKESMRKMKDHASRLKIEGPAGDFPDMLSSQTMKAIENPGENKSAWDRLKDEMVRDKIIPTGTPDEIELAARVHVQKVKDDYLDHKPIAGKLPASAYDRSLQGLTKYVNEFADRASLREAFGSKTFTPAGAPTGANAFDIARKRTTDPKTINYINMVENLAYGRSSGDVWNMVINAGSQVATTTQLANWKTTAKNLTSGVANNVRAFGIVPLWDSFKAIKEGREKGILLNDLTNQMNDANKQGWLSKAVGFSLKSAAFNASESLVRGQAIVGSRALYRWGLKAYKKNPKSRASLQFLGLAKRLGFGDPEALIKADGQGPLFDTFLRRMVNRVQAGYTYADVPLYLSSDAGKFIQQYSKYGTEHLNTFFRDIGRPFIRNVGLGKRETVELTNPETGARETVTVPGEIVPMFRYLFVLAAAGAGWEWIAENAFGTKSQFASWDEIGTKLNRGDRQAIADALGKSVNYLFNMGALGVIGEKIKAGVDVIGGKQSLKEAILDIPGLSAASEVADIAQDFFDKGDWRTVDGWKTLGDNLGKQVSYYRVAKEVAGQVARRAGLEPGDDAFGSLVREAEKTARMQDRAWVRATGRRFDSEMGIVKPRMGEGSGPTAATAIKERLWDHVMLGEVEEAQALIDEQMDKLDHPKDRDKLMDGLKASVRNKQPINAAGGGEAGRVLFNRWAEENLPAEERARLERIDEEYRETATQLGLMKGNKHVPESEVRDLREALLRAKERREQESFFRPIKQALEPAFMAAGFQPAEFQ